MDSLSLFFFYLAFKAIYFAFIERCPCFLDLTYNFFKQTTFLKVIINIYKDVTESPVFTPPAVPASKVEPTSVSTPLLQPAAMAVSTPKTEAVTPHSIEAPPHSNQHNAPANTTVPPPPLDPNSRPINAQAVAVSTPTTTSTPTVFAPVDSPIATDFAHLKLHQDASTPNNNAQHKEQDFFTIPSSE